ncbi:MAG: ribosomal protein S18-alanine N-acetyltransferase [Candidatus Sericytochromatia bacterium]|nr:ribosomal protein S18-alanine N-acetyltransferase [Candidatus Sericytochromatia bacterium]
MKNMLAISPMSAAELDDVARIERLAFGERWSVNSFKSELANPASIYYVARWAGEVVAYIGYWLILDEAHVTAVAVHPEHRLRGLGAELVMRAIDDCMERGAKWMTLEVRASNIPAQRLYEGFGFSTLGRRKGYYHDDREDALIMWTDNLWHDAQQAAIQEVRERLQTRRAKAERSR